MKIIYVENVRIPSERAHAYQIVQFCAWMARLGHDVTLVNPARAGLRDLFSAYDLEPGLFRHEQLAVFDPLSWAWFPFKVLAYALQRASFISAMRGWIRGKRTDIWYTRDPAMVDALADAVPQAKWVLELHDAPDHHPRWQRIRGRVEMFVVISRGLKEKLISLGIPEDCIHVAPDGFDPKDFVVQADRLLERKKFGIPDNAFVVIYTGSFYPWKGVDLAVRSWHRTPKQFHLLLIGGPAEDRDRLSRLSKTGAASDRIHIFPTMPHREAISALAAADIGLLSTASGFAIGKLYTSPLKQFEYLAAGLPVLASDVPSSHEILDGRVAKFYSEDDASFARIIVNMVVDREWREQARMTARQIVQPFTWEARVRGIAAFLVKHIALAGTEKA